MRPFAVRPSAVLSSAVRLAVVCSSAVRPSVVPRPSVRVMGGQEGEGENGPRLEEPLAVNKMDGIHHPHLYFFRGTRMLYFYI